MTITDLPKQASIVDDMTVAVPYVDQILKL